jgi:predicted O-methyltransferase YrrM
LSNRTINLDDKLYEYLLKNSVKETAELAQLREVTMKNEMARMQIAPEQGQFMALMVELLGASHIIEVGTFTGYSALSMALALPDDGKIICCDISKEWTDIGVPYWEKAGVANKIDLRIGQAMRTLKDLIKNGAAGHFDMAFVDADKTNYANYFELCLALLRPGGLLMFDNTLWDGDVADDSVQDEDTVAIRQLNQQLLEDDRISMSLVPIGDGLTLCRKH